MTPNKEIEEGMPIKNIQYETICEFVSFSQWVNKASSWIGGSRNRHDVIICLDKNGNVCHIGEDFQRAKILNLFPVTAYKLIRTSHNYKNSPNDTI